eukprot:CAMPEP_0169346698 /NCGR_PEP_ID=MMETSP1017-20121227/22245_1 /TAXON_ID=342587 /ORGANISM="Karlodinium micrum, Strain CCMP2283" /LENGTH=695 /DNA_ID=CAMNT_0009442631 /DNA_START=61 /DNA_END=2145 /DNA_ORIENTATION=-
MGNGQTSKKEDDVMSTPVVDLGFANIDTKKLSSMAEALQNNKIVKKLCLGWNGIGDSGAERLAEALEKNTTLTELNLTENGIGEKGAEKLAAALHANTTLRVLDLMSNRIGDKGAGYFASALSKNKTLQELRLYDTGIEYSGASRLMSAAERNETLLVLDIRWNDISDRRLVSRMEQSFARNRGHAARKKGSVVNPGDLEIYIVSMREKISSNGEFGPYLNDSERQRLLQDLNAAEAWLQSNRSAPFEEYSVKLEELKAVGDVVSMRHKEGIMRGQMITAIYSTIANYRGTVESPEDTNGVIDSVKKGKILTACKELEDWLTTMTEAQENLPAYERPVLQCSDMVDRNLELANMVAELMEDSQCGQAEALREVAASSARGTASARSIHTTSSTLGSNERRSQLIAYINHFQDKIAVDGEFGAYVSEAERERLSAHLVGAAVWASQTTGVLTAHYVEKLQELRSVGDVIEWRCDEDSMRADWIAAVLSTIANCRNAANNPGDKYESVSAEKHAQIMRACQELEDWLRSMDAAQSRLAKYERPVLLCADMERRNLELAKMVGELLEESGKDGHYSKGLEPHDTREDNPPEHDYSNLGEDGALAPPPADPYQGESRTFIPPMRGTGKSPRKGKSSKSPRQLSNPPQPRAPAAPPEPGGNLRAAGKDMTEEERLLELDALDAACSLIVDEDDEAPPMAG